MDLDVGAFRWVKVENLERLAAALRVPLPVHRRGDDYHRHLSRRVATAIEHDKWMAAAEQRKAMEREQAKRLAAEIADLLGENGGPGQAPRERVERQIALIQLAIGDDGWWIRTTMNVAAACHSAQPTFRTDGDPRTMGGAFFAHARKQAYEMADLGQMPWKVFYRSFCWREPTPKEPRPKPAPKPKKPEKPVRVVEGPLGICEAGPDPGHVMHRTRGGKGVVGRLHGRRAPAPLPEVYVVRRKS